MEKSKIKKLLSGICCSACRADFDEDAITILRKEQDLLVLKISCTHCKKSFGIAFLGASEENAKDDIITSNTLQKDEEPLEFKDCPMPISFDDVLDAHKFFDKLDKDWTKYIPDDFKK